MFKLPEEIVIFDTECTTWKGAFESGWSGLDEHRELIQLAAVRVRTRDFAELLTYKTLVKPRRNPVLSDYCIDLTGISQKDINERGFDFATVLQDFYQYCADCEIYFFDKILTRLFDMDVLIENCDLYGLKFPFNPERFHNVNEIFRQYGYTVTQSGASPEVFGIKIPARPHDALNDVRGLIISLKALSERVK